DAENARGVLPQRDGHGQRFKIDGCHGSFSPLVCVGIHFTRFPGTWIHKIGARCVAASWTAGVAVRSCQVATPDTPGKLAEWQSGPSSPCGAGGSDSPLLASRGKVAPPVANTVSQGWERHGPRSTLPRAVVLLSSPLDLPYTNSAISLPPSTRGTGRPL